MSETDRINGVSALELTMRDVLGNVEELANGSAWQATGWDSVEIVPAVPVALPRSAPPKRRPVLVCSRPERQVA